MIEPLHCVHCGGFLGPLNQAHWPKVCGQCGEHNYNSPKPVIALVLHCWESVRDTNPTPGIVVVRRGIEPYKGTWAFPGGYIDHKEPWRVAAQREAREEVGARLDQNALHVLQVTSTPNNFLVMFVGHRRVLRYDEFHDHDITKNLTPSGEQEITAIDLWRDTSRDMGIPAHNNFWRNMRLEP